jgi:hypothetical protein
MKRFLEKTGALKVRVPKRDLKLILKLCNTRRITISDFVREAIAKELASLGLLSAEEKNVLLGISKKEEVKIE